MPQLNPEFFISQLFWLIIVFSLIYLFISKYFIPKIGQIVDLRERTVNENIQISEQMIKNSDIVKIEIAHIIQKAKIDGSKLIENATKSAESILAEGVKNAANAVKAQTLNDQEELMEFKLQLDKDIKNISASFKSEISDRILTIIDVK